MSGLAEELSFPDYNTIQSNISWSVGLGLGVELGLRLDTILTSTLALFVSIFEVGGVGGGKREKIKFTSPERILQEPYR